MRLYWTKTVCIDQYDQSQRSQACVLNQSCRIHDYLVYRPGSIVSFVWLACTSLANTRKAAITGCFPTIGKKVQLFLNYRYANDEKSTSCIYKGTDQRTLSFSDLVKVSRIVPRNHVTDQAKLKLVNS